ncbi:DUF6518 family protein [Amycolatopsis arida]|uniref:DUF6518 family protein n=1 Tax=Amycolatopsis arida TaxID=587909 RepID=UPI00106615BD|nr:DUF6518 family protein [Amycolatopsis arida]
MARFGRGRPSGPRALVIAVLIGVASGAFGAGAYYSDALSPLAHTVGLWVVVGVAVSARLPTRTASTAAVVSLLAAVVAFEVGKTVIYVARYPGTTYSMSAETLAFWSVVALMIGPILGLASSTMGRGGWKGPASIATICGILLGEAIWRQLNYNMFSGTDVAVVFDLVAAVVIIALNARTAGRLGGTLASLVPATALGYAVTEVQKLF